MTTSQPSKPTTSSPPSSDHRYDRRKRRKTRPDKYVYKGSIVAEKARRKAEREQKKRDLLEAKEERKERRKRHIELREQQKRRRRRVRHDELGDEFEAPNVKAGRLTVGAPVRGLFDVGKEGRQFVGASLPDLAFDSQTFENIRQAQRKALSARRHDKEIDHHDDEDGRRHLKHGRQRSVELGFQERHIIESVERPHDESDRADDRDLYEEDHGDMSRFFQHALQPAVARRLQQKHSRRQAEVVSQPDERLIRDSQTYLHVLKPQWSDEVREKQRFDVFAHPPVSVDDFRDIGITADYARTPDAAKSSRRIPDTQYPDRYRHVAGGQTDSAPLAFSQPGPRSLTWQDLVRGCERSVYCRLWLA